VISQLFKNNFISHVTTALLQLLWWKWRSLFLTLKIHHKTILYDTIRSTRFQELTESQLIYVWKIHKKRLKINNVIQHQYVVNILYKDSSQGNHFRLFLGPVVNEFQQLGALAILSHGIRLLLSRIHAVE